MQIGFLPARLGRGHRLQPGDGLVQYSRRQQGARQGLSHLDAVAQPEESM